mmetsp:Transcript_60307/g.143325  ORF Transcript_60307/g.143325 Transcript_60307/m.143325 type:complete len:227 (-) Transcript_60307:28-708(-)
MSVATPYRSFAACPRHSGLVQAGAPTARGRLASCSVAALPTTRRHSPSAPSSTLAILRSRCRIECACRWRRPRAMERAREVAVSTSSGRGSEESASLRHPRGWYTVTMTGRPSESWNELTNGTTLGCFGSRSMITTSEASRAPPSPSLRSTFIATDCPLYVARRTSAPALSPSSRPGSRSLPWEASFLALFPPAARPPDITARRLVLVLAAGRESLQAEGQKVDSS